MLRYVLLLVFIFSLPSPKAHAQEYVVNGGDILTISVWGEEDMDQELTVNENGDISFPLIGKVKVEGLTLQRVDEEITGLLQKDYFVNPDVTVSMAILQFFITGEVKSPGAYPILGNITPLQAVTLAGGFTDFSSHTVKIIRKEEDRVRTIKVNVDKIDSGGGGEVGEGLIIRPNDVIIIPRSFF